MSTSTSTSSPTHTAPSDKKKTVVQTLDEKHTEMLNHFHVLEIETIPKLIIERKLLKKKLDKLATTAKIDIVMDLTDKIRLHTQKINQLRLQKKRYLLDNSRMIFQYFEDKKNIASGKNVQNSNAMNAFFGIKSNTGDGQNINSSKYAQSHNLYHYWKNVNGDIANLGDLNVVSDVCEYCHRGELIPQEEEGVLICNNEQCGKFVLHIVDNSKPSNKEPPNEASYTAYARLNHFKEILSQFQAKETTQIPKEVLEQIRNRIKKERITDLSTLNYFKMRDILRQLNLNKYFEHIQYINSIFGVNPPVMNEELHNTLCVLFIEIQRPWAIHCPPSRRNFFNYTYTLYQLCVLLDQQQYLPYIPLLKDREKQLEQDMIWKKVCQDLDWMFFPTV